MAMVARFFNPAKLKWRGRSRKWKRNERQNSSKGLKNGKTDERRTGPSRKNVGVGGRGGHELRSGARSRTMINKF